MTNANGPRIEIYHKTWCSYSRAALALLNEKGVAFEDIDVTGNPVREAEMVARSANTSVPEIFIDGALIGGYDELAALRNNGRLDRLLGVARQRGISVPHSTAVAYRVPASGR